MYESTLSLSAAEVVYSDLSHAANCSDLQCLLHADADHLAALLPPGMKFGGARWGPVVDGVRLKAPLLNLMRRGEFTPGVPVVIGSCLDEGNMWFEGKYISDRSLNASQLRPALRQTAGLSDVQLDTVQMVYDPANYSYPKDLGNYSLPWWQGLRVNADLNLGHCCARRAARALLDGGAPAVHQYIFAHAPRHEGGPPMPGPPLAFHGSEISFVFNIAEQTPDTGEHALAQVMSSYWVNFATAGNPNGDGLPVWPAYSTQSDASVSFSTASEGGVHVQHGLRHAACDYWDAQDDDVAGWRALTTHC